MVVAYVPCISGVLVAKPSNVKIKAGNFTALPRTQLPSMLVGLSEVASSPAYCKIFPEPLSLSSRSVPLVWVAWQVWGFGSEQCRLPLLKASKLKPQFPQKPCSFVMCMYTYIYIERERVIYIFTCARPHSAELPYWV